MWSWNWLGCGRNSEPACGLTGAARWTARSSPSWARGPPNPRARKPPVRLAPRAAEQQRTQPGLMALLAPEMAALSQITTQGESARKVPARQAAPIAVTRRYALAATTAAADYYEAEREAAGAVSPFTVELADIPPEKAERSLSWAVKDLWLPEEEEPPPIEERMQAAQTK